MKNKIFIFRDCRFVSCLLTLISQFIFIRERNRELSLYSASLVNKGLNYKLDSPEQCESGLVLHRT